MNLFPSMLTPGGAEGEHVATLLSWLLVPSVVTWPTEIGAALDGIRGKREFPRLRHVRIGGGGVVVRGWRSPALSTSAS